MFLHKIGLIVFNLIIFESIFTHSFSIPLCMSYSKILLVVIDGISDRPVNGKTPLSSAKTPVLDSFAEEGVCGIMDPISPGVRAGSDTGHFALLGYPPEKYYPGRGPIEAAGVGIDLKPGDIAFRANFATVEDREGSFFDKVVVDRRAGRFSNTDELADSINEGIDLDVEFIFKRGSGHRGALVLRNNLSDRISGTDPKVEGKPPSRSHPLSDNPSSEDVRTAEIVNTFSEKAHQILKNHPLNLERAMSGELPANAILLRGPGKMPHVEDFKSKFGLSLSIISGTALIKGVGRILGGDVLQVEGATGGKDTDLEAKVKRAMESVKSHDFILLHIKAPDEYGHDGDFDGKKKFIEKVDRALKPLSDLDDCYIAITADHSTPVTVKDHSGDPVPVVIRGEGVRRDDVKAFSEFTCYRGGLCRIRGLDLVPILLDLAGVAKKYGA